MATNKKSIPSPSINPKRQIRKKKRGFGLYYILGKTDITLPLEKEEQLIVDTISAKNNPLHNVKGCQRR
jgi:hypothetical protein